MFPAFVTDVCCGNIPPTFSFTEYAGSVSWQLSCYQAWALH
jgi:hypothetical protein